MPAAFPLLQACELPTHDIDPAQIRLWQATEGGALVGTIGCEVRGGAGLVRSLAVSASHRGRGLADSLFAALVADARAQGLRELYALTTTAEGFFLRLGFERIERSAVPVEILAAEQFRSICPSSAAVLRLRLD